MDHITEATWASALLDITSVMGLPWAVGAVGPPEGLHDAVCCVHKRVANSPIRDESVSMEPVTQKRAQQEDSVTSHTMRE